MTVLSSATHTWALPRKVECVFEHIRFTIQLSWVFSSVIKQPEPHYKTNDHITPPTASTSQNFFLYFSSRKIFEAKLQPAAKGPFGSRKTVITNIPCFLRIQETGKGNSECLGGHIFCFKFGFQNVVQSSRGFNCLHETFLLEWEVISEVFWGRYT